MEAAGYTLMMESGGYFLNLNMHAPKYHGFTFQTSITFSVTALETSKLAVPYYPPIYPRFPK
jgi:hypothetical protein